MLERPGTLGLPGYAEGNPEGYLFPATYEIKPGMKPVAILKTAKNVEAARAFVDWQLSEEAQRQSVAQGYFPIFDGVAPPKGYPALSSLKIMNSDLRDILAKDEDNKKRFSDLFGG